MLQTHS